MSFLLRCPPLSLSGQPAKHVAHAQTSRPSWSTPPRPSKACFWDPERSFYPPVATGMPGVGCAERYPGLRSTGPRASVLHSTRQNSDSSHLQPTARGLIVTAHCEAAWPSTTGPAQFRLPATAEASARVPHSASGRDSPRIVPVVHPASDFNICLGANAA
jgi:hypothetical protein